MTHCQQCGKVSKQSFLDAKLVCIHCDELVLDMEIEVEEPFEATRTKSQERREKTSGIRTTKTA